MMTPLLEELRIALVAANINPNEIENKEFVIESVRATFVHGNPRAWWMGFPKSKTIHKFEDNSAYLHLQNFLPSNVNEVFFIVDDDNESMYVYKIQLMKVKEIIKNCQYFEYCIVDTDFSWIVAENDHGDLIVAKRMGK